MIGGPAGAGAPIGGIAEGIAVDIGIGARPLARCNFLTVFTADFSSLLVGSFGMIFPRQAA